MRIGQGSNQQSPGVRQLGASPPPPAAPPGGSGTGELVPRRPAESAPLASGDTRGEARRDSDALLMGVGCAIMLGAVVVIAAVFAFWTIGNQRQNQPPQPTGPAIAVAATPAATPTPIPTPTQIPTIRPTPLPTWTPLPSSAPQQKVVDYRGKDADYRADVTRIGDFVQASLGEVDTLLKDPQPQSDHWAYQMTTQVEPWKDFFGVMQQVEPPTQYQQANDAMVKALARLDSAADDILYAVDYGDTTQLKSAQDKIAQGSKLLQDAMAALKSSA
ncbi:MAG TPA: hypothetical protein VFI42_04785 [Thermomicrobiaceae bacterium]|nr:hypothetical protein [Thermomicrobiaceae bacterium]